MIKLTFQEMAQLHATQWRNLCDRHEHRCQIVGSFLLEVSNWHRSSKMLGCQSTARHFTPLCPRKKTLSISSTNGVGVGLGYLDNGRQFATCMRMPRDDRVPERQLQINDDGAEHAVRRTRGERGSKTSTRHYRRPKIVVRSNFDWSWSM